MIKSILFGLCLLVTMTLALNENAHAQSGDCTAWIQGGMSSLFGGGTNALVEGVYNCQPVAPWTVLCQIQTANCVPAAARTEICLGCLLRAAIAGPAIAGAPINLATGNTYIQQTDVSVPGLSGGLNLVRTWNSLWPPTQIASSQGIFGPNWRSTFEERVFVGSDHYVRYARSDGSYWSFGIGNGQLRVIAPANVNAALEEINGYLTLTFQNGEQRRFDNTSGSLVAIVDRNGNTTQLTYDSLGRLATVTDPVSRHLYFTYANASYTFLVSAVTSDVGLSLAYSYDAQGRLSQVTEPDLTTLTFAYDSQSRILSVTDSNGKIIESHTYDAGARGLTSSRAAGVDAVTITYSNP
jgi:YD repeat-containing protein